MTLIRWAIILGVCLLSSLQVQAETLDRETFTKANQAYQEGRFQEAQESYLRLLEEEENNGHLHYNLGNSYFKQGNTGHSIWHFLKAANYLPRDEDVEANLRLALRETTDIWDGRKPSSAGAILFWLEDFTLSEHLMALVILNLFYWGLSGFSLVQKGEGLEGTRKMAAALTLVAFISSGARWTLENSHQVAVVHEKSLDAVAAQTHRGKLLYQFHEGAILSVLSKSGDWLEIELPNGEKGWVKKNGVLF